MLSRFHVGFITSLCESLFISSYVILFSRFKFSTKKGDVHEKHFEKESCEICYKNRYNSFSRGFLKRHQKLCEITDNPESKYLLDKSPWTCHLTKLTLCNSNKPVISVHMTLQPGDTWALEMKAKVPTCFVASGSAFRSVSFVSNNVNETF